jgi:hypothetical protein
LSLRVRCPHSTAKSFDALGHTCSNW